MPVSFFGVWEVFDKYFMEVFMRKFGKKREWKRLLALLLVIAMVTGTSGTYASAESGAPSEIGEITAAAADDEPGGAEAEVEFLQSKEVSGVKITVSADPGVFPEDAQLFVEKVSLSEEKKALEAVEEIKSEEKITAENYTFDIKVLDASGEEIQPDTDKGSVRVSFAAPEVSNANLDAEIYHIKDNGGDLTAEILTSDIVLANDLSDTSETVTAETDGFSYYTVEFTYNEKQYVMEGDSEVPLTDILSYVGITKADGSTAASNDITAVSVSNESLFSASAESGEWMVTAHQAFHTDEWMKVTVDSVEYEIIVTDTQYSSGVKFNDLQVGDVLKNGSSILSDDSNSSRKTATIWVDGVQTQTIAGAQKYDNKGNALQTSYSINNGDYKVIELQDSGSNSYWIRITRAIVNDASYTSSDKTYNGSPQTGVTGSNVALSGNTSATNAGTYTAYAAPNSGHAWSDGTTGQKTITWTINKASNPLSYTTTQSASKTFSTSAQTATLTAASNGQGTVSYAINSQKNGSTNVSYFSLSGTTLTIAANTPVGTYTVVVSATAAGNNNYNSGTKESTVTVTIGNAAMTGVSATGYTGTYDAAAHSITVNKPSGATVKYRTASSGDYTLTTNPTYTDAGTYTVYYQVTKTNYTSVTGSATVQINPKKLTLNWGTNNAFTYNGLSQAPTATIDGVINNDDCTVSVSGVQTNYSGEAYTATAELIGERAGNYALPTAHTMTFTIGKKDATITASDQTITYGEAIATGTGYITTDGFVPGDSPTAITLTPSTSDVTTSGTITPSAAAIKKGTADVTDNYNITYHTGNLTINKKTITISGIAAEDKTYDGTTAVTLYYNGINWTDCGRVGTDDLTVTAAGTFSDANVGSGKIVAITDLTLGGTKAGNYELASSGNQTSTTAAIHAKAITITADSDSKVYDGTVHTKNSYSITSGGLASDDSIESVTVTGSQKYAGSSDNVPSAAVIKNSLGVDVTGNYDITYNKGTLTVTQKPLTITADSDEKVYDTTPLTKDSYTNTALAEGDAIKSVTITGTQTVVGSSNNVPSAAVIKKGDVDVIENYAITYVNGTLTISKGNITPIVSIQDWTYGDYKEAVNAPRITGNSENGEVTYTYYKDAACETKTDAADGAASDGGRPEYAGTYYIKAAVSATGNYNEAVSDAASFRILKRNVEIEWTNTSFTYDGETHLPTAAIKNAQTGDAETATGVISGDSISVTVKGEEKNAGTYTATATELTGGKAANYKLPAENTKEFTIAKRAVTISGITASDKYYDGSTAATINTDTVIIDGLVEGDSLSVSATGAFADKNAGAGKTVNLSDLSISGTDAANYILAEEGQQTTATAEIKKAKITITADDKSSKYKADLQELTYQVAPAGTDTGSFVSGDDLGVRLSTTADNAQPVGEYPITVSWNENPNYEAELVNGKYTITKTDVTVSATGHSGTYDGAGHGITVEVTGVAADEAAVYYSTEVELTADNYSTAGSIAAPTMKDAGTTTVYFYVVAENIDPTPINGSKDIVITKKDLTVTANDNEIIYGSEPANKGVTYEGLAGSDTEADLAGEIKYIYLSEDGTAYKAGSPKGEYTIAVSGLSSDDYEITYVNGKLTVNSQGESETDIIYENQTKGVSVEQSEVELADIVLTDEEKQLIEDGAKIDVYLTLDMLSELPDDVKELILSKLADGYVIGNSVDINLYKQYYGEERVQLHDTVEPLTFTLAMEGDTANVPDGYTRDYKLYRVHQGTAGEIEFTLNSTDKTVGFSSDKFSIFVIAYKDTKVEEPATETPAATATHSDRKTDAKATGDDTFLHLYILLLILSFMGATWMMYVRRKKENKQ